MKPKIINLMFGGILCLLTSCHSNAIYFDMEQQAVIRCKGTISNLYIISRDKKDFLRFSILPEKEGSYMFYINELNKNYSIEIASDWIQLQNFKLRPETEYEIINHSNGDATDGKLIIRTDRNSFVNYANITSCK